MSLNNRYIAQEHFNGILRLMCAVLLLGSMHTHPYPEGRSSKLGLL